MEILKRTEILKLLEHEHTYVENVTNGKFLELKTSLMNSTGVHCVSSKFTKEHNADSFFNNGDEYIVYEYNKNIHELEPTMYGECHEKSTNRGLVVDIKGIVNGISLCFFNFRAISESETGFDLDILSLGEGRHTTFHEASSRVRLLGFKLSTTYNKECRYIEITFQTPKGDNDFNISFLLDISKFCYSGVLYDTYDECINCILKDFEGENYIL